MCSKCWRLQKQERERGGGGGGVKKRMKQRSTRVTVHTLTHHLQHVRSSDARSSRSGPHHLWRRRGTRHKPRAQPTAGQHVRALAHRALRKAVGGALRAVGHAARAGWRALPLPSNVAALALLARVLASRRTRNAVRHIAAVSACTHARRQQAQHHRNNDGDNSHVACE